MYRIAILFPVLLAAQPLVPNTYYRTFSHTNPVLRHKQGEIIATQTLDSSGRDFRGDVRHPESGNPLTGPFYRRRAPGCQFGLYALLPDAIRNLYSPHYKPDLAIPGPSKSTRWPALTERNRSSALRTADEGKHQRRRPISNRGAQPVGRRSLHQNGRRAILTPESGCKLKTVRNGVSG